VENRVETINKRRSEHPKEIDTKLFNVEEERFTAYIVKKRKGKYFV